MGSKFATCPQVQPLRIIRVFIMKTTRIYSRAALLTSLAVGEMQRKDIERALKKARQQFARAREAHVRATVRLEQAQREVDKYSAIMQDARETIAAMSDHLRVMDLSGATGFKEQKGENFYTIDGSQYAVDCSDVNDVKMKKKKDFLKEKKEESEEESDSNSAEEGEEFSVDVGFADDFARYVVASSSKRFRQ
jgi:hypothetical protein